MTSANGGGGGGGPIFPRKVHHPVSPSICPAVLSLQRGLSTNPWVTMWCVYGCICRDDVFPFASQQITDYSVDNNS